MKKLLLFTLLTCFTSLYTQAQYVTIPDANFRAFLKSYYPSCFNASDQIDTTCYIFNAQSLNCSNKSISNLDGIQYFKKLESLLCNSNFLSSLPTLPSGLTFIDCSDNQLTSLPILPSGLQEFTCKINRLTSLPSLPAGLYGIDCDGNQLTSLPSLPSSLINLTCSNNHLTYLPTLPSNLGILDCSKNQLTSLPTLPSGLVRFICSDNQLGFLPSLPTWLRFLDCSKNQLSFLQTLPSKIEEISIQNNLITTYPTLPSSVTSFLFDVEKMCIPSHNITYSVPSNAQFCTPLNRDYVFIPDAKFRTILKSRYTSCFNSSNHMDTTCSHVINATSLEITSASISNIDGVQYFKGLTSLYCSYNKLTSLPILSSFLTRLECHNNQLTSLPTLPSDLHSLLCYKNKLTSLPSLPSSLKFLECYNNLITSFPILPSELYLLHCYENKLTHLPNLPTDLKYLYCYNNQLTFLPTLNSGLTNLICFNNKLNSLPTLPSQLEELYCIKNPNLKCLPFLPSTLKELTTDVSCIPNKPSSLTIFNSSLKEITLPICSPDNANNCFVAPSISGKVYVDVNGNNIQDSGEPNAFGINLSSTPGNYTSQSAADGSYAVGLPNAGTYIITPAAYNASYFSISPATQSATITANGTATGKNFALKPLGTKKDLVVSVSGGRPRPGFDISYWITVYNAGNTTVSGTANFTPASDLTYLNSLPAHTSNSAGVLGYAFPNLAPLQTISFQANFNLPPDVSLLGKVIDNIGSVTYTGTDETPANNIYTLTQTIRVAYDPNEKHVSPNKHFAPGTLKAGTEFLYTIYFQNTGSDTAFRVIVKDTISAFFDLSSMVTIESSHKYTFSMINGRAEWRFDNILLPDSGANQKGCNGFITYKIKVKNDLQLGQSLTNTAYIYFDFNPHIQTNTTSNEVKVFVAVEPEITKKRFVYPNPSKESFRIGTETPETYTLYNSGGTSVLSGSTNNEVNVSALPSGVYLLKLSSGYSEKVVVE